MATKEEIARWARTTFGPSIAPLKPTATEIAKLYEYAQKHPGVATTGLLDMLIRSRPAAQGKTDAKAEVFDPPATPKPTTAKPVAKAAASAAGQVAIAGNTEAADAVAKFPPEAFLKTGGINPAWYFAHRHDPLVVAYDNARNNGADKPSSILTDSMPDGATPVYVTGRGGHPTSGGEQSTVRDVLTGFYKMDADAIRSLKERLWDGHWYPAGTDKAKVLNSSQPDPVTRAAYALAIQHAARLAEAGQNWTVDIVIAEGNPDPSDATGAATTGPYTITNPADLKQALNSAAQERLGRDLDKHEIETFAKLYQGLEAASSQRYAAAGRNKQEMGIVAPPSQGAAAADYLDQHFAQQEQAYGSVQRMFSFFDLLGPAA